MWSRCAVLLASAIAVAQARPMAQADAFFSFHSNAWLNLHHILWSRGEGAPLPADLPEAERTAWAAGIEFYAPYSRRNLISDDELITIKEALRNVEGRTSLDGIPIDSGVRTTLERLMPIYRKHWWPPHDRTNREWIAAVRPLVDRHGAALDQATARAYDVTMPDNPVWVDVSVRAHPVGAYETGPVTHVMISSIYSNMCGASCEERMALLDTPSGGQAIDRGIAVCARRHIQVAARAEPKALRTDGFHRTLTHRRPCHRADRPSHEQSAQGSPITSYCRTQIGWVGGSSLPDGALMRAVSGGDDFHPGFAVPLPAIRRR